MSLTFLIPGTSETHTEGFPYEIFRHRETKYFQRKIVILLCIKFSIPQIFWNFEAMPAKFFGTVRPSLFDGKTWYPLLCIKIFDTPNFLKHWRDAHEMFWHCETKNFRLKIVTLPPPSPPLLSIFFSKPDFFWYTDQKGSPTKFFSTVRQRFFDGKSWYSLLPFPPPRPLIHKFFRYQKVSETKKGSPTKYFRYCKTTIFFIENRAIPLLGIKFFDTQNFLRHRRFPRRNFSELWDEDFSTENRDTLLHKVHKSVVELMFVRTFWKLISKQ